MQIHTYMHTYISMYIHPSIHSYIHTYIMYSGLTSTALLRELATQFMAIDRMQTAEDLIRRALTQEAADGNVCEDKYSTFSMTIRIIYTVLLLSLSASKLVEQKTTWERTRGTESGIYNNSLNNIDTYIHTYIHL